jgi:hypothetical protein
MMLLCSSLGGGRLFCAAVGELQGRGALEGSRYLLWGASAICVTLLLGDHPAADSTVHVKS